MSATPITPTAVTHLALVQVTGVVTSATGTAAGTGGNTITVPDPSRTVLVVVAGATPGTLTFSYAATVDGQTVTNFVTSATSANAVYVLANWPAAFFGSTITVTCSSATTQIFPIII